MSKNKSRVTKRTQLPDKYEPGWLAKLDRRTNLAQQLHETYDAIVRDCGGLEELAATKIMLIERFVWLDAMLQTLELKIAEGGPGAEAASGRWIQGINALTGLAKSIGLKRELPKRSLRAYVEQGGTQ